jgi:hypothetical protein
MFSEDTHAPLPFKIIFPLAGVFVIFGSIASLFYNLHNATGKNRFSTFDITSPGEESDPIASFLGQEDSAPPRSSDNHAGETIEEKLSELDGLRDKKLITAEEYALQRRRILDEI